MIEQTDVEALLTKGAARYETEKTKFYNRQRVQKTGGSYQATGTIVAAFHTLAGEERYVFEFDNPPGMLHIFGPKQLESLEEQEVSVSGVPYKVPRSTIK